MNPQIAALIDRTKALEAELDAELAERRADLRIGLEHGRIVFEQELLRRHRELQVRLAPYLVNARPLVILTTPFIYLLIIPIMLLDACVMLYQAICFPVYGIPKVPRGGFSCSTGRIWPISTPSKNSIAHIAPMRMASSPMFGRSRRAPEEYWCPIKHAKRVMGTHARYAGFEDYGDADADRSQLEQHRAAVKKKDEPRP